MDIVPEKNLTAAAKIRILNLGFALLLLYQFVILIVGASRYHLIINAAGGLCLFPLAFICLHLFMNYAKGVCVAWYEFEIR